MSPLVLSILIVCFTFIITGGAVLFVFAIREPRTLDVSYVKLSTDKYQANHSKKVCPFTNCPICVLPTSHSINKKAKLRVLFFCDLHVELCFISANRIIEILDSEIPNFGIDAVIFGGDFVNETKGFDLAKSYINSISKACKERNIPFFGVLGNHDVKLSKEQVNSLDFTDICDESIVLKGSDGTEFTFEGIGDSGRDQRVWYQPPIVKKTREQVRKNVILLAHNPDSILYFEDERMPDYMLSGHIHGGQIRTPIGIEFSRVRKDVLPKQGVISGVYDYKDTRLFISRGLGCVLIPLRLMSQPEVSVVEFYD